MPFKHHQCHVFLYDFRKNFFENRVTKFQSELRKALKSTDIQICMFDNWNKMFKVCTTVWLMLANQTLLKVKGSPLSFRSKSGPFYSRNNLFITFCKSNDLTHSAFTAVESDVFNPFLA